MPHGYCGKILYVDLTTGEKTVEEPSEGFYRMHLGGWGFIAHELLKNAPKGVDPFAPENPLVIATGILTGTPVPGSGRHAVGAKSPLTAGFGEADVGGYWGVELKRAGFDAVVVTGASERPVYLWIRDGEVEIRDASDLWGKKTAGVEAAIRSEHADAKIRVLQCGIAGENLVRYACVISDVNRAAGRGGLGGVMGAKRLRAIAVRGTGDVEIADSERLRSVTAYLADLRARWAGFHEHGTAGNVIGFNEIGRLPSHNFQEGIFDGAERITGTTLTETLLVGRDTCHACPIACKRVVESDGAYTVRREYGGPEYETVAAFGSNCCVDDLEAIVYANQLCNAYGLDTISTGGTIAWLMEAFEKELLGTADTGGIDVRFGDAETMVRLVELIARREGIGDLLAEGSSRAAAALGRGTERLVVTVKNQEIPYTDARMRHGLGLGYATSPSGADHIHSAHDDAGTGSEAAMERLQMSYGIGGEPMPPNDLSPEKVRWAAYANTHLVLYNCVGTCYFHYQPISRMRDLLQAVTGWDLQAFELMKAGERALAMARAFNVREGLTPADDALPSRMYEPLPAIGRDAWSIDRDEFLRALSLYYGMMGWDEGTGVPKAWKLHELGIGWVVDELS